MFLHFTLTYRLTVVTVDCSCPGKRCSKFMVNVDGLSNGAAASHELMHEAHCLGIFCSVKHHCCYRATVTSIGLVLLGTQRQAHT